MWPISAQDREHLFSQLKWGGHFLVHILAGDWGKLYRLFHCQQVKGEKIRLY